MNRNFLFDCYQSSKGDLLQSSEMEFLRRSITVGCKQSVIQIGGLGFEGEFIDSSLYQRFVVIDKNKTGCDEARKIAALPCQLPVLSNSVDMVILPHLLEFEADQHQTLREIDRILKPEGKLIILNFNPWNVWLRYKYMLQEGKQDPFMKGFISRSKIIDWLKLLNFEVEVVAGFKFKAANPENQRNKNSMMIVSYAVRAIKRRYNMIPLTTERIKRPQFAVATAIETSTRLKKHE